MKNLRQRLRKCPRPHSQEIAGFSFLLDALENSALTPMSRDTVVR
jgi:hypothetical protein